MVTVEKDKNKTDKYAQCTSCHCTGTVHEVLIGKCINSRLSIQLCDRCMKSLIGQYNGTHKADAVGLVYPVGSFKVGPFICEVVAKYADKVEVSIAGTHNFGDYVLTSILAEHFGTGILVSNYSKGCVAAVPIENIAEIGGLL